MNNYEVCKASEAVLNAIRACPPASLSDLGQCIEKEMENAKVEYGARRCVAMKIAGLASALAPASSDPVVEKLLKKVASCSLDVHDRWAGGAFFTRGQRRETKALLSQLEMEARATASAAYVVDRAVSGLVAGMERSVGSLGASLVNATRELGAGMTGAANALPAPIINVNSDAHFKMPEAPKPEAKKTPKRIGPDEQAPEGEPVA